MPDESKSEIQQDADGNASGDCWPTIRSALRTLLLALPSVFSLLSFPSVTPWMIAFWIGWSCLQILRNKSGWMPMVACLITLLLRPVAFTPFMSVLIATLMIATVLRYRTRNGSRQFAWIAVAMWIAWGTMTWEWRSIETCSQPQQYDLSRPIVCLGDSLTEGLHPDRGYPDALKSLVRPTVINLGFSGIATSQGLGQMDRVLSHDPQVVIIELGGHDFLKGHSRTETHRNLTEMIQRCREANADVILMEIPRGFIFDPFRSIERQVAYEEDVQLISDTWLRQSVLQSPIAPPGMWMPKESHLSSDGIHTNRKGSEKIASDVADALVQVYGDQLRRDKITAAANSSR